MSLRRIEDRALPCWVLALRETLAYRLNHPERRERFAAIAARRARERIFLVGNAPSLAQLDLDRLAGEDYMLCNMIERLEWTRGRVHPYYLAADTGVTRSYEQGRPKLEARQYFYAQKLERRLDPAFARDAPIFWFAPAKGGVARRGLSDAPWISVAAGSTILITAAQLAWALGYREIYVVGCDLDYGGADRYAYGRSAHDTERDQRGDAIMRESANHGFAILRDAIAARGGLLANAGVGGRLDALTRTPFASLFS